MAELQAENVRLRAVIVQHERKEVTYLERERELEMSLQRAQTQRDEYKRKWKATNLRYKERDRLRTNWIPL
jgi:translation initiation factor RLI1